jgi:hypothetical protein
MALPDRELTIANWRRIGFRIRAFIGRHLASCIDAWNDVRPPKDDYERWLVSIGTPRSEALGYVPEEAHH